MKIIPFANKIATAETRMFGAIYMPGGYYTLSRKYTIGIYFWKWIFGLEIYLARKPAKVLTGAKATVKINGMPIATFDKVSWAPHDDSPIKILGQYDVQDLVPTNAEIDATAVKIVALGDAGGQLTPEESKAMANAMAGYLTKITKGN